MQYQDELGNIYDSSGNMVFSAGQPVGSEALSGTSRNPFIIPAAIAGIGSLLSGIFSASASEEASEQQATASTYASIPGRAKVPMWPGQKVVASQLGNVFSGMLANNPVGGYQNRTNNLLNQIQSMIGSVNQFQPMRGAGNVGGNVSSGIPFGKTGIPFKG